MDCSTPGFPVLHHLPELAQTHVHQVGDAIQPKTKVGLPFYFPWFQVLPTGSIQELPRSIPETVHFHDESVQSQNFPDSPAFIWPVKTLAMLLQLIMKAGNMLLWLGLHLEVCSFFPWLRGHESYFFKIRLFRKEYCSLAGCLFNLDDGLHFEKEDKPSSWKNWVHVLISHTSVTLGVSICTGSSNYTFLSVPLVPVR